MDIKKIDKIKAPEDWVEEALNLEKIQGISHRRNSMKKLRTAAAVVVIFVLCGTFVTVAATKSNVFQSLLENMFGKENVTEVELNPEPAKEVADVKAGKDGAIQLHHLCHCIRIADRKTGQLSFHYLSSASFLFCHCKRIACKRSVYSFCVSEAIIFRACDSLTPNSLYN